MRCLNSLSNSNRPQPHPKGRRSGGGGEEEEEEVFRPLQPLGAAAQQEVEKGGGGGGDDRAPAAQVHQLCGAIRRVGVHQGGEEGAS